MPPANALSRFSDRVADYVRCRPGYPAGLVELLTTECGLQARHVIADIGSGTGISSRLFLERGHEVFAVEPNDDMRLAAEAALRGFERFHSVKGQAEASALPDASVDWVVAAQAFHWFDVGACRCEFARILRGPRMVLLAWNDRRNDKPFLAEYERLLYEYATDYKAIDHRNAQVDGRIDEFFAPRGYRQFTLDNEQRLDFEGLAGRLLSSSYMPGRGHVRFEAMMTSLRRLFDKFQQNGRIDLLYATRLFVGGM